MTDWEALDRFQCAIELDGAAGWWSGVGERNIAGRSSVRDGEKRSCKRSSGRIWWPFDGDSPLGQENVKICC